MLSLASRCLLYSDMKEKLKIVTPSKAVRGLLIQNL